MSSTQTDSQPINQQDNFLPHPPYNYRPYSKLTVKRPVSQSLSPSNPSHNSSSSLYSLFSFQDQNGSPNSAPPVNRPSSSSAVRSPDSPAHTRNASLSMARSPSSPAPSASSTSSILPRQSQVPFRAGFQPRGVYRDRTDELVGARNAKQESKRLEEARLQKRLEKLVDLHFPHPLERPGRAGQRSASGPLNLSQKFLDIVTGTASGPDANDHGLGAARTGGVRAREQAIVRWQEDGEVRECAQCRTAFGLRVRKHHCRLCGTVVCFSAPSGGRRERCSTMVRFEWAEGAEKRAAGRLVELSEQEMGIPDDAHAVLQLIAPASGGSKRAGEPAPAPARKGVRVCRSCLSVVLRRQAMTCPPPVPDYVQLYGVLRRLQDEIERTLPEFQETMVSAKHPSSNLNPSSTPAPSLQLLTLRKKLLTSVSLYDSASKRLGGLAPAHPAEARLLAAVTTRAGFFLRDTMALIRSLGGLEFDPAPKRKKAAGARPRRSLSTLGSPATRAQPRPRSQVILLAEEQDEEENPTAAKLIQLNVLLEQERLVEGYLEEANARRQLEDAASLKVSLDDLREEISNLKRSLE